jgi:hypothetical protein
VADTRVLESKVEDYVRSRLQQRFKKKLWKDRLPLTGRVWAKGLIDRNMGVYILTPDF